MFDELVVFAAGVLASFAVANVFDSAGLVDAVLPAYFALQMEEAFAFPFRGLGDVMVYAVAGGERVDAPNIPACHATVGRVGDGAPGLRRVDEDYRAPVGVDDDAGELADGFGDLDEDA